MLRLAVMKQEALTQWLVEYTGVVMRYRIENGFDLFPEKTHIDSVNADLFRDTIVRYQQDNQKINEFIAEHITRTPVYQSQDGW